MDSLKRVAASEILGNHSFLFKRTQRPWIASIRAFARQATYGRSSSWLLVESMRRSCGAACVARMQTVTPKASVPTACRIKMQRFPGAPMTSRSFSSQAVGLIAWLLASFAAGALGAVASVDAASFYAGLSKPSWAPPASVFGPVWSVLYALMGIAAWLVWRSPRRNGMALGLFGA